MGSAWHPLSSLGAGCSLLQLPLAIQASLHPLRWRLLIAFPSLLRSVFPKAASAGITFSCSGAGCCCSSSLSFSALFCSPLWLRVSSHHPCVALLAWSSSPATSSLRCCLSSLLLPSHSIGKSPRLCLPHVRQLQALELLVFKCFSFKLSSLTATTVPTVWLRVSISRHGHAVSCSLMALHHALHDV